MPSGAQSQNTNLIHLKRHDHSSEQKCILIWTSHFYCYQCVTGKTLSMSTWVYPDTCSLLWIRSPHHIRLKMKSLNVSSLEFIQEQVHKEEGKLNNWFQWFHKVKLLMSGVDILSWEESQLTNLDEEGPPPSLVSIVCLYDTFATFVCILLTFILPILILLPQRLSIFNGPSAPPLAWSNPNGTLMGKSTHSYSVYPRKTSHYFVSLWITTYWDHLDFCLYPKIHHIVTHLLDLSSLDMRRSMHLQQRTQSNYLVICYNSSSKGLWM